LLFAVFTIATCGLMNWLWNFGELFIGDSVKQFSFIIGVYLFRWWFVFFEISNQEPTQYFVEIEILVGLVVDSVLWFCFIVRKRLFFPNPTVLSGFVTGCLVGLEIRC
jgi:spermidine synthase